MHIRNLLLATVAVAGLAGAAQAENTLKWGANRDIGSLDPYSYGDSRGGRFCCICKCLCVC